MKIIREKYFNIISNDISTLSIVKIDVFNCELRDKDGNIYKGFLLSETPKGEVLTICDLDFQKSATDNKYQPRLIFRKTDEHFINKKLHTDATVIRIPFHSGQDGYRGFWKMISFLYKFKDLVDLDDFEQSYMVVDNNAFILEFETKKELEKIKGLSELFLKAHVSEDTIKKALEDTRKETLKIFKRLLEDKEYWKAYNSDNFMEVKGSGPEMAWHHFLKKNDWILGLNVRVCFLRDLLTEVEVGISNTVGSGSPTTDFLGISDYTVLVELKTSDTNIFTATKRQTARANTWSFSDHFIDGISQCLGQKFDWDKNHENKALIDSDKNVIDQNRIRTVDPKSIFLIGNKSREIPEDSTDIDIYTKRDTLERFRRSMRNVEILTFDELYQRAFFIVHNKTDPFIMMD
jgi:hypothetical protein